MRKKHVIWGMIFVAILLSSILFVSCNDKESTPPPDVPSENSIESSTETQEEPMFNEYNIPRNIADIIFSATVDDTTGTSNLEEVLGSFKTDGVISSYEIDNDDRVIVNMSDEQKKVCITVFTQKINEFKEDNIVNISDDFSRIVVNGDIMTVSLKAIEVFPAVNIGLLLQVLNGVDPDLVYVDMILGSEEEPILTVTWPNEEEFSITFDPVTGEFSYGEN